MDDYRNTEYCANLADIKEKKLDFKKQMIKDHPKIQNFYKYLHDKDGAYKLSYIEMYNSKCVYCGNSLKNISINLFEIDHFINEASFLDKSKAHQIENLVPACQMCNRGKRGLNITGKYVSLLDPEGENIKEIFSRSDDYSISVTVKYKNDVKISEFYAALSFSLEQRRLDFLLLKMRGLYQKLDNSNKIKGDLLLIIDKLQKKRNCMY